MVEPAIRQALADPLLWPTHEKEQISPLLLQQRESFLRAILTYASSVRLFCVIAPPAHSFNGFLFRLNTLRRFKAMMVDYADFRNGKMTSDFVVAYQM